MVVLPTPEPRELREEELQKEAPIALKKCRKYGQQVDWAPFVLPAGVVCPAVVPKPPATIVVGGCRRHDHRCTGACCAQKSLRFDG